MDSNQFEPGNVVRVWWTDSGKDFEYTARVIGAAQRKGDFVVEVINPGPGSGVKAGSRLAPTLGVDDTVKMELAL